MTQGVKMKKIENTVFAISLAIIFGTLLPAQESNGDSLKQKVVSYICSGKLYEDGNERLKWGKKQISDYGKKEFRKALEELLSGKLKDLRYPDPETITKSTKENIKRCVLKKLGPFIPTSISINESLKFLIEDQRGSPRTRLYALQTLLRRHPTMETQKYAFEKMKAWVEYWYKNNEKKRIARMAADNWRNLLSTENAFLFLKTLLKKAKKERGYVNQEFRKYESPILNQLRFHYDHLFTRNGQLTAWTPGGAETIIKKAIRNKRIGKEKTMFAFVYGMQNPVIRKKLQSDKWFENGDASRKIILEFAERWIKYVNESKDFDPQRQFYKTVALFKLLDQKLPDKYKTRVKRLSEEEKEKIDFWHTQFKFNLDAYQLDL